MSDFDKKEFELFMRLIREAFALPHTSYRMTSTMQRSRLLFLLMHSPTFRRVSLSMRDAITIFIPLLIVKSKLLYLRADYKDRTCALTMYYEISKSDHHSVLPSGLVLENL